MAESGGFNTPSGSTNTSAGAVAYPLPDRSAMPGPPQHYPPPGSQINRGESRRRVVLNSMFHDSPLPDPNLQKFISEDELDLFTSMHTNQQGLHDPLNFSNAFGDGANLSNNPTAPNPGFHPIPTSIPGPNSTNTTSFFQGEHNPLKVDSHRTRTNKIDNGVDTHIQRLPNGLLFNHQTQQVQQFVRDQSGAQLMVNYPPIESNQINNQPVMPFGGVNPNPYGFNFGLGNDTLPHGYPPRPFGGPTGHRSDYGKTTPGGAVPGVVDTRDKKRRRTDPSQLPGTLHPQNVPFNNQWTVPTITNNPPIAAQPMASTRAQKYESVQSSVANLRRTNGLQAPVQLSFNSPDQARPYIHRRVSLKITDDTVQDVRNNMAYWVRRIMNAIMHTGFKAPPRFKPNGKDALTNDQKKYWIRWQRDQAARIAVLLRLPGMVTEIEARAWLIVEEFIMVSEEGYALCALTEAKKLPCIDRLELAEQRIDEYAILKTDILDDFKVLEFAASPEGYVHRKIQNLWVNERKKKKNPSADDDQDGDNQLAAPEEEVHTAPWNTAAYKKRLTNAERNNMRKRAEDKQSQVEGKSGAGEGEDNEDAVSDGEVTDTDAPGEYEDGNFNTAGGMPTRRGSLVPQRRKPGRSIPGFPLGLSNSVPDRWYDGQPWEAPIVNKQAEIRQPRRHPPDDIPSSQTMVGDCGTPYGEGMGNTGFGNAPRRRSGRPRRLKQQDLGLNHEHEYRGPTFDDDAENYDWDELPAPKQRRMGNDSDDESYRGEEQETSSA